MVTRKQYTKEYKLDAVSLVLDQRHTTAEVSRSLMREAGIQVRHQKKYKVATDSNHKQPVFENKLNRQFDVAAPNQIYVDDITYIWTQEGWLEHALKNDCKVGL